tara:strand:+ start:6823 stop:7791 length:969 start_codon:yes stop_codon:yes gene_type:complete
MRLSLAIKPYSYQLLNPIHTSQGFLHKKKGWLLKVEDPSGHCGWGEVSPLNPYELTKCEANLNKLTYSPLREEIEEKIVTESGALGFGFGAALAEMDCLVGKTTKDSWLKAPKSAILLPKGNTLLSTLNMYLQKNQSHKQPLTFKWKVGIEEPNVEKKLLEEILAVLPINYRIRIDANGGWSRKVAKDWSKKLAGDPRLDWLEQPLTPNDSEGLLELSKQVPIALDESLRCDPSLRNRWKYWQVRHPVLEGDPRELLKELNNGKSFITISTSFETGIGSRWVNHMAALQHNSSTPTAPGLAPGWFPKSELFSNDPHKVWEAA